MRHDDAADHARRNAPAGGMRQALAAFAVLVLDARSLREIGAEIMAGARLQRLAVLHHRLDRPGLDRARETLVLGLFAGHHRQREVLVGESAIDLEHGKRVLFGLSLFGMRGMAFLPQEFAGAQEHARAHFPAHDIGPLVELERQVAPALDPARHGIADDRFRRRADNQRFFQLGFGIGDQPAILARDQPVMRDHRHFLCEAFDMLCLALEVRQRDEDREIGVFMPRRLDPVVEQTLHAFPDAKAPRADHHAATHARFLGHFGGADDVLVPGGEIIVAARVQGMADLGHGQYPVIAGRSGARADAVICSSRPASSASPPSARASRQGRRTVRAWGTWTRRG